MNWLKEFSPFLVGPVLEGTVNSHTPISIHVSCDAVEEVVEVLQLQKIDFRVEERRFKLGKEFTYVPTLLFFFQQCEIAVTIFNLRQQHQIPKSKIQNRNMQRMNIKSLENLLNQN